MITDMMLYLRLCQTEYPLEYDSMHTIEAYTRQQADQASAEVAYFHIHHDLPKWSIIIDYVEDYSGNFVFVHNDTSKVN